MKTEVIPSAWLHRPGTRLNAATYTSGAFALQERLRALEGRTQSLGSLTKGHQGGVYRPPIFQMQFSRNLVDTPEHGVPFMTSSAMLLADLSHLPLVSKKVAKSPKFAVLELRPEMTLISCSGTIGRVIYAREEMRGVWSSQDMLKVVPDQNRVPPGYLFAFLSSPFGVQLLASGAYGAIVKHIEREHIVHLPVPRLSEPLEGEIHDLVTKASQARSAAASLTARAAAGVRELLGTTPSDRQACWNTVSSSQLQDRCDAYYFSSACVAARRAFDGGPTQRALEEVAEVFIPGIFKRLYADDPQYGIPYVTGRDVFQIQPASERFLLHRVVEENRLAVQEGMILTQEAGQLGGLIGRSVFVGRHIAGFAVSNNMIRTVARDRRDAGFLFALLSSTEGIRLIARESAGSSIPHIDASRIRRLHIPWPSEGTRHAVSALIEDASTLQASACADEDRARALIARAIEEAT